MNADGGSRGNPGPAGIGIVLSEGQRVIKEISEKIGKATNNQAEYFALLRGLKGAKILGADEIDILMDSELVVKQINREYKVKDEKLAVLFVKVWNILSTFSKWSIKHISREKNKKADALVNKAMDQ